MPWTFVEIVDEGRMPNRGDTAIHALRGRFNDGINDLVVETFWYFTPASTYAAPTNPQKAARRDEILAQLNAPVTDSSSRYGALNADLGDTRLKLVHGCLRLARRVVGADRYTLLMRYLGYISILRNQRPVFWED